MSWLERAFARGAKEAERLPEGELRTLAEEGLDAWSDEDVVEVLERHGEDALRGLAVGVIGGAADPFGGFRSEKPGIAGVIEELEDAHAQDVRAFDVERQDREDRAVLLKALGRVGVGAGRVGLTLLVTGAAGAAGL